MEYVGALVTGEVVGDSPLTGVVGATEGTLELEGMDDAQKRWSLWFP